MVIDGVDVIKILEKASANLIESIIMTMQQKKDNFSFMSQVMLMKM